MGMITKNKLERKIKEIENISWFISFEELEKHVADCKRLSLEIEISGLRRNLKNSPTVKETIIFDEAGDIQDWYRQECINPVFTINAENWKEFAQKWTNRRIGLVWHL